MSTLQALVPRRSYLFPLTTWFYRIVLSLCALIVPASVTADDVPEACYSPKIYEKLKVEGNICTKPHNHRGLAAGTRIDTVFAGPQIFDSWVVVGDYEASLDQFDTLLGQFVSRGANAVKVVTRQPPDMLYDMLLVAEKHGIELVVQSQNAVWPRGRTSSPNFSTTIGYFSEQETLLFRQCVAANMLLCALCSDSAHGKKLKTVGHHSIRRS